MASLASPNHFKFKALLIAEVMSLDGPLLAPRAANLARLASERATSEGSLNRLPGSPTAGVLALPECPQPPLGLDPGVLGWLTAGKHVGEAGFGGLLGPLAVAAVVAARAVSVGVSGVRDEVVELEVAVAEGAVLQHAGSGAHPDRA